MAKGVEVYDNAAVLKLAADGSTEKAVPARLLIDGMGNFSPIVCQVCRLTCMKHHLFETEFRLRDTGILWHNRQHVMMAGAGEGWRQA